MKKCSTLFAVLAAALFSLAIAGCTHDRGSQEFTPGKGWRPVR